MKHNPLKSPMDKSVTPLQNVHRFDRTMDRIIALAQQIENKIRGFPELNRVCRDVVLCLELIRDYRSGAYRQIAVWALATVAFALFYLVSPLEVIPDVIPLIGYLDDIAVMTLALKLAKGELRKYAAWRQSCSSGKEVRPRPMI